MFSYKIFVDKPSCHNSSDEVASFESSTLQVLDFIGDQSFTINLAKVTLAPSMNYLIFLINKFVF